MSTTTTSSAATTQPIFRTCEGKPAGIRGSLAVTGTSVLDKVSGESSRSLKVCIVQTGKRRKAARATRSDRRGKHRRRGTLGTDATHRRRESIDAMGHVGQTQHTDAVGYVWERTIESLGGTTRHSNTE